MNPVQSDCKGRGEEEVTEKVPDTRFVEGNEESNVTPPSGKAMEKQWKSKITLTDKSQWLPEQKTRYNTRTGIILREAAKLWSGNGKIYFKNEHTKLQLEELTTKLLDMCSIPEIGFGYEHTLSSGVKRKNRRITNGYDYEVQHKPAKRAKVSPQHIATPTSCQDSSDSDTDTDHDESPSTSLEDMSLQSAKIAALVAFNATCLQDLGVKTHLIPLAKKLGVKHRSLGKRAMLLPIANQLFKQGYLEVKCSVVDYKRLKRPEISVCKPVCNSSPSPSGSSKTSLIHTYLVSRKNTCAVAIS
ncbi:hypothetical protein OS493_038503 [Desmophyllum pertusum]|uniref:Uncharacterized protein n=1 Tax=Desmophyllum pertusum TaxID=174260 RepID=A0A9X0CVI7_9CNID|nr:hypothetical protein OS493_038503 [Desmophyllum pertusum]